MKVMKLAIFVIFTTLIVLVLLGSQFDQMSDFRVARSTYVGKLMATITESQTGEKFCNVAIYNGKKYPIVVQYGVLRQVVWPGEAQFFLFTPKQCDFNALEVWGFRKKFDIHTMSVGYSDIYFLETGEVFEPFSIFPQFGQVNIFIDYYRPIRKGMIHIDIWNSTGNPLNLWICGHNVTIESVEWAEVELEGSCSKAEVYSKDLETLPGFDYPGNDTTVVIPLIQKR